MLLSLPAAASALAVTAVATVSALLLFTNSNSASARQPASKLAMSLLSPQAADTQSEIESSVLHVIAVASHEHADNHCML
jgi:hypothetical protein